MAKSFLCLVGDRRRPVSFNSKDDNDYSSAVNAVRRVFNDVIPETSHLFLQVKNEFWGGEFTDINALEEIPNRSLVRAVVEKPSPLPKVSDLCKIGVSMQWVGGLFLKCIKFILGEVKIG